MKNLFLVILAIITTTLFFSCRQDEYTEEPGTIIPTGNEPVTIVEGNLTGIITDINQRPISNAEIQISGETGYTDDNGVFRFINLDLSSDGSLIKIIKEGYFDGFQFTSGLPGENSYIKSTLVKKEASTFNSTDGAVIPVAGGSSITFQANSIEDDDGEEYQGQVIIYAHYYNPSSEDLHATMPGDLRGIDLDNNEVQLLSYGMMAVELYDPSGAELQLASGTTATLTFPVGSESDATKYNTIPTWHLDESTGTWIEEGEANIADDYLTAEVSHFSFWNCDAPFPVVNISGTLVTEDGNPLPNFNITIKDKDNNLSRSGYTNESGFFSGKVPAAIDLILSSTDCKVDILNQNIGSLSQDSDLGERIVSIDSGTTITANLIDCSAQPVVNGYAKISSATQTKVVSPDANGNISYILFDCDETEHTFTGIDIGANKSSESIPFSTTQTEVNLSTVAICGDGVVEHLRFSFDSGASYNTVEDIDVIVADDAILYIYGIDPDDPSGNPIYLMFKYDITANTTQYNAAGLLPNGNVGQDAGEGTELELDLSPITNAGDYITGTFKVGRFEGDFNLKIDRKVQSGTVKGKVWWDENENGIRDAGEPPLQGKVLTLAHADSNEVTPSYYPSDWNINTFSDEEGNFEFNGIILDRNHFLRYVEQNGETVSMANAVTDENIDSDFLPSDGSPNKFESDPFSISEGEELSDLGLGLNIDTIRCSWDYLCCPTAGFSIYFFGGAGPFQVTVSEENGPIKYDEEHLFAGVDVVLEPDLTYVIEVEDSAGNKCFIPRLLPRYLNMLGGNVWVDASSGVPNEKDPLDIDYEGMLIKLLNEAGEVIDQTTSTANGSYYFENFEGGKLRIKAELPVGFEFVEEGDELEYSKSHIDPLTGISLEKSIGGWDFDIVHTMNVGIREK